jgi:hypothetical protein
MLLLRCLPPAPPLMMMMLLLVQSLQLLRQHQSTVDR